MIFFVGGRVGSYLGLVADGLLLFTEGQQHLLDLVLVEVDVGVHCDVLNNVTLHLEGIKGLSRGLGDQGHESGLVGASHRLYKLAKKSYVQIGI